MEPNASALMSSLTTSHATDGILCSPPFRPRLIWAQTWPGSVTQLPCPTEPCWSMEDLTAYSSRTSWSIPLENASISRARTTVCPVWSASNACGTPRNPNVKSIPPNRLISGVDFCLPRENERDNDEFCSLIDSCQGCASTSRGCVWCKNSCKYRECSSQRRVGRLSSSFGTSNNQASVAALESKDPTPSSSSVLGISRPDECPPMVKKQECQRHHICHSCITNDGCEWHVEKISKCREARKRSSQVQLNRNSIVPIVNQKSAVNVTAVDKDSSFDFGSSPCGQSCSEKRTCGDCMGSLCMWCKNLHMCTDRNAYLASFPYGQCMDWTTQSSQCPSKTDDGEWPYTVWLANYAFWPVTHQPLVWSL